MAESWQCRANSTGLGRLLMREMVQRESILCALAWLSPDAGVTAPYQLRVVDVGVATHVDSAANVIGIAGDAISAWWRRCTLIRGSKNAGKAFIMVFAETDPLCNLSRRHAEGWGSVPTGSRAEAP